LNELIDRNLPVGEVLPLLAGAFPSQKKRQKATNSAAVKADFYRLVVNFAAEFNIDDTLPQSDADSLNDAGDAEYPLFMFAVVLIDMVKDASQNRMENVSLRAIFDGLTGAKKAREAFLKPQS
jgi:hypothetical protein